MDKTTLGQSDLAVTRICLGTMTFGAQADESTAHRIMDAALELGINFFDTAEMYAVPPTRESFGKTEAIIGKWFAQRPGARRMVVLASKITGPSRNMDWIRNGASDLKPEDFKAACDDSLRRLKTDVIDLYQIHWPNRNAPVFGQMYYDPSKNKPQTSIEAQLRALQDLVQAGKVRHVGLSNETPWGLSEFLRLAQAHGLPRVQSVQNPYSLINRVVDNGLDEVMHRSEVSLLAYSPLGFGTLTGKYDDHGIIPSDLPDAPRLSRFESMRKQRWARQETIDAARRYNALAWEHGLKPYEMALAFCFQTWRVASTIIGVRTLEQLQQCVQAWSVKLTPDVLEAIDRIRQEHRDPAQ
ncbi:MAG: aldo/keto reductase [Betaproteobacteria bacterium]|nr:aldo/keto reductase [Betaproteobacteria bacterium]